MLNTIDNHRNLFFYDIGSGTGKVCFVASKYYKFKKVHSIELYKPAHDVACNNLTSFIKRNGKNNISFYDVNCLQLELENKPSVLLFFNPFTEVIFQQFLDKNLDKLKQNNSYIAFNNCLYPQTLINAGFKLLFHDQVFYSKIRKL